MTTMLSPADGTADPIATLRSCAYCPNTCRPSYPASAKVQIETQTPSALSLIALAWIDGRLGADSGAVEAMQRRDAANASRGHCTYGFDMPKVLDAALKGRT